MAPPETPRTPRVTAADMSTARYPRALLVSVVAWIGVGVLLVVSRLGRPAGTDADDAGAQLRSIGGPAGNNIIAPEADSHWFVPYVPVLGIVIIVLAIALALGQGWARLLLALLGMLAVIVMAMTASWLTIPVAVLFLVGAIASLMISAHRYLSGDRSGRADRGSVTTP